MAYEVIQIDLPDTDAGIQDEIRDATSAGSKLICITVAKPKQGSQKERLIIVTESP